MRGRKPKAAALHQLHGNPSELSKRELRSEPQAPGTLHEPPAWMTDEQKASWTYAIEHAPVGVLRAIDKSVLATWVVAEDTHRRAAEQLQRFGLLVKQGEQAIPNPHVSIMNKQALILIKAAGELGFTPVSRARMRSAGHELPPDTPAAEARAAGDEFDRHMASRPH